MKMPFDLSPVDDQGPRIVFLVKGRSGKTPSRTTFPYVVLHSDTWNDYGYETTFSAHLKLGFDDEVEFGRVKILNRSGSLVTELPPSFEQLPDQFCSLGTTIDYYEAIADQSEGFRRTYFEAMRDVATDQHLLRDFEGLEGFKTSLLRDPAAEQALKTARAVVMGETQQQAMDFSFIDRSGTRLSLQFSSSTDLPSRLNAIIGYNGSGKTRILADLAHVASMGRDARGASSFAKHFGRLTEDVRFSSTVAVSFSPFDTFQIPDAAEMPSDTDEQYSYVYCGLRSFRDEVGYGDSPGGSIALKSSETRRLELLDALELLKSTKRRAVLANALHKLHQEPSFDMLIGRNTFSDVHSLVRHKASFRELSSGHQIALSIVILLAAHLKNGSLALIDEPETHLHPPLLAALIKAVLVILNETESFAVVATHSPIVLQEIPSSCVNILKRSGQAAAFHKPRFETYGESLDLLTSEAFHRDNSESTYEGHLRWLVQRLTSEEILALFPQGPSNQALSIMMQAGMKVRRRKLD